MTRGTFWRWTIHGLALFWLAAGVGVYFGKG